MAAVFVYYTVRVEEYIFMPASAVRIASRHLAKTRRTATADVMDVVDAIIDGWGEAFLGNLARFRMTESDVDAALSGDLSAEDVNAAFDPTGKTAGIMDTVTALGGKVLSGAWHMITHPFIAAWKMATSSQYRAKVIAGIKRAIRHEVRATRHMVVVAQRLISGEEVKPQEVRAAVMQFVDLAVKVLIGVFVGPHIAHLFAHGVLKALASLLSPIDEVIGVMIDKPLRWATQQLIGESVGLLPSGFYTHF